MPVIYTLSAPKTCPFPLSALFLFLQSLPAASPRSSQVAAEGRAATGPSFPARVGRSPGCPSSPKPPQPGVGPLPAPPEAGWRLPEALPARLLQPNTRPPPLGALGATPAEPAPEHGHKTLQLTNKNTSSVVYYYYYLYLVLLPNPARRTLPLADGLGSPGSSEVPGAPQRDP